MGKIEKQTAVAVFRGNFETEIGVFRVKRGDTNWCFPFCMVLHWIQGNWIKLMIWLLLNWCLNSFFFHPFSFSIAGHQFYFFLLFPWVKFCNWSSFLIYCCSHFLTTFFLDNWQLTVVSELLGLGFNSHCLPLLSVGIPLLPFLFCFCSIYGFLHLQVQDGVAC